MQLYIGKATSRIDGVAKVTGRAKYAADSNAQGLAYASLVTATIPRGKLVDIDASEALRVAGVLDVLSHRNRPAMASTDKAYHDETAPEGSPYRPLYDGRIRFNGQPIALVIAETAEIARFAASLVRAKYQEEAYSTDLLQRRYPEKDVAPGSGQGTPPKPRGSLQEGFAAADVRHEAEYFVPIENHNPMELYASTVMWDGEGKLTIWDKTQGVQNVHRYICSVLGLNPDDVRIMTPYMGGGFGSGLRPQFQVVLATMAALALKRSVRLVLTRQQMYVLGYRPATVQRIALGADSSGSLDAMLHEATTITSTYESFHRQETGWSGLLYTCDNAKFVHKLAPLDLATPCDMRAPSAATGVFAIECAMDELAVSVGIDPLELRLRNYSEIDQNENRPYTSKALRECYRQGAKAFGWEKRNPEPGSMRDGNDLIGWGMATGVWEALQMPMAVRIRLMPDGRARVACAATDIGTGTYTIMAQVAADRLGLPIDRVAVELGKSDLPQSPVQGGSWIATSVAAAICSTCDAIRDELLALAKSAPGSPFADAKADDVVLADGALTSKRNAGDRLSIADVMGRSGNDHIECQTTAQPTKHKGYSSNTHSAIFAEVRVDAQLGVIRTTRVVNAVAAGRILNTKTAGSQIMGAVVGGVGMALEEETLVDHTFGRIMNADIAEYHVPVNADIHDVEVIFVEERDDLINPLGMKGVGEIGIVGVAAAIANACYHATGTRVRQLPITLDKLNVPDRLP
ncbi:MAG TPA: xanthine dehydrogenase family protein molybdopterin-binding subunit [Hyphomicrobium sp.]|nr:xanthine dehydrogenase family protein molybdopterin-binding subunit [Hyphomicrobium sp.]